MDREYIKARCREVAKADAALKVRPSAAAVALDYIIELEAQLDVMSRNGQRLYKLEQRVEVLRRDLDNIKVRSYELGQRELHDMALTALEGDK